MAGSGRVFLGSGGDATMAGSDLDVDSGLASAALVEEKLVVRWSLYFSGVDNL